MGKGYHNYMSKKFFHPTNPENMRRVFMAEEKEKHSKEKNEEMIAQYRREQDTLEHRAMLGDKKAQMGLSFMYDAPAGLRKAEEEDDKVPDVKFEWQRKYNAPRESWAKGNEDIADQPFGIEVRNTRCIRCHQWGHSNTDRICPLYGQDLTMEPPNPIEGQSVSALKEQMKEQGLALKQGVLGHTGSKGQELLSSSSEEEESDPEVAFLQSLTDKQRVKLLKKVAAMKAASGKKDKDTKKKDTKKKKKSKKSKKRRASSTDTDIEDERPASRKKSKRKYSSVTEDDSDESPNKRSRAHGPKAERPDKKRSSHEHEKRPYSEKHAREEKPTGKHVEKRAHRDTQAARDSDRHARKQKHVEVERDVKTGRDRQRDEGKHAEKDRRSDRDRAAGRVGERHTGRDNHGDHDGRADTDRARRSSPSDSRSRASRDTRR